MTRCLTDGNRDHKVYQVSEGKKGGQGGMKVSRQTWCLTSTQTTRLIREKGGGGMEVSK